VGSARRECLDHMLIFDRQHLEKVMASTSTTTTTSAPHQGIEQRWPGEQAEIVPLPIGQVERWAAQVLATMRRLGRGLHPVLTHLTCPTLCYILWNESGADFNHSRRAIP